MTSRNLEPGQYQLGDFIFGDGTLFNVVTFDPQGWDVNAQDSQAQNLDELMFGSDSFKPNPIQVEITARRNRMLPHVVALLKNAPPELNFENDRRIGDFTREWRADEIRKQWGALKPLYVCRPDGSTVVVYGRPGKLAVGKEDPHSLSRKVVGEFRRSDTLCYNEIEWFLQIGFGELQYVYRSSQLKQGDAPSWLRLLLVGPMEHPIINIGDITIELDYELEIGDVVEISSYPWERRCVRLNDGLNLAAHLVSPYLYKLNFDVDKIYELSWNATNANTQVEERDFAEYDNTAEGLPVSDWYPTVYSSGAGSYHLAGGELVWADSGSAPRLGVSIFKLPTVTNYQRVGFTMASPGEAGLFGGLDPTNRIIGRANADATEYLFWEIGFAAFWYGYHKDGVDYQLSPIYSLDTYYNVWRRLLAEFLNSLFGTNTNWTWEADFGTGVDELGSTLRVNGVTLQTFADTAATAGITVGSNKLTGTGMKATTRALGQSSPGTISKYWLRDNSPTPADVSAVYLLWRDAWQNI